MYKVLFAEDELLVRLGLQNSIPWEKYQMEVAALAENGLEAYQLFEKVHPDVLITDLRMEGMDGVELVRRVREIDKECAVVVISCLNDFETLRKLIPYNINAYVLKASISIDEVCNVLKQVQDYLLEIGRTPESNAVQSENPEKRISDYLLEETDVCDWKDADKMEHLLLFNLKEEDQDKINMLAMDFIYELVNRQLPGKLLVPLREKEFCIFYEAEERNMEERMKRINSSIEDFLGVKFQITHSRRREKEELKAWFDRAVAQQYEVNYDDNSGKALILKAVAYMQSHYQESLSLTDISRIIGLSGSYFSYLFKQETGKNYVEYLNEIRLEAAMKDLKISDEKIVVIAQKHGFQNLEYFSRYFKKKTGESPAKVEKIKSIKRMDWRQKVLLSILGSFLVIMSLLFYITYHYFVNKVEEGNEEVVLITFEQAEKDLENILKDAELCLDKYMTDDLVWKFVHEYPKIEAKRSRLKVGITDEFTSEMSVNREISSLGILCSDGFGIMSSSSRKNRTGYTVLSEKLQKILAYSKENYPYTTWLPGWELDLEESSPFSVMLQNSGLIGIKAMGESEALDEESFLFVSIDESNIQNTYNAVAFNDSVAVLVDENDRIISNVGEEKLGEKYAPGEDTQNIEYPLGLYGWKLCNMIPKADYMKDANDIRNFGLAIILIAILATAIVAVIWSRKYTQPIELLMENMHRVKRQEFDIEKPEHLGWEELDLLNEELFETAQSIKDYIERLKQAEQEKTKEELLALQYQMNPHFLLNSLNSIRWMAMMTNNKVVADTLVTLSKIITPVLRNPSLTWKLENEIEFLENYVSMMQLRYGHDMEYQLDCAKELYDIEFPRLILQPLIENCFVHGSTPGEMRTIHILIQCRKDIEVTIVNSGVFFEEEELDKIREKMRAKTKASDHIGLANVCKRLNLLYQEKGVMRITSNREIGFIVQIRFPQHVQM